LYPFVHPEKRAVTPPCMADTRLTKESRAESEGEKPKTEGQITKAYSQVSREIEVAFRVSLDWAFTHLVICCMHHRLFRLLKQPQLQHAEAAALVYQSHLPAGACIVSFVHDHITRLFDVNVPHL
jgi:hypothetical protein